MKLIITFLKFLASEFIVHRDVSLDYYQAVDFCESAGAKLALYDNVAEFQCVCKSKIISTTNTVFFFSFRLNLAMSILGSVAMILRQKASFFLKMVQILISTGGQMSQTIGEETNTVSCYGEKL